MRGQVFELNPLYGVTDPGGGGRYGRSLPSSFGPNSFIFTGRNEVGPSNIFTGVCLSTGRGRGVCLSACWDIPPGADSPREQTPPDQTPPPGADAPPQTRPSPQTRHPPRGSRLQHTVNERPVRILLECILVVQFLTKMLPNNRLAHTCLDQPLLQSFIYMISTMINTRGLNTFIGRI